MQASLRNITFQLEDIGRDIKSIIAFQRREALSNKFIYARDRILSAANAEGDERIARLEEADVYLNEGLSDLYVDLRVQIQELDRQKGPFASLKAIDTLLSYINEDMQLIPRYVGLRLYLSNYRKKTADANRILGEYKYQLQTMNEKKLGKGKYTALEIIHRNFSYNSKNVDFWLREPKRMLNAINTYQLMIEQKNRDIYYIDAETDNRN